MTKPTEHMH